MQFFICRLSCAGDACRRVPLLTEVLHRWNYYNKSSNASSTAPCSGLDTNRQKIVFLLLAQRQKYVSSLNILDRDGWKRGTRVPNRLAAVKTADARNCPSQRSEEVAVMHEQLGGACAPLLNNTLGAIVRNLASLIEGIKPVFPRTEAVANYERVKGATLRGSQVFCIVNFIAHPCSSKIAPQSSTADGGPTDPLINYGEPTVALSTCHRIRQQSFGNRAVAPTARDGSQAGFNYLNIGLFPKIREKKSQRGPKTMIRHAVPQSARCAAPEAQNAHATMIQGNQLVP
ncbi:unnamed protein product, partial [Iphiclides podalirius]